MVTWGVYHIQIFRIVNHLKPFPISPELSCINSGGIVIAASNWHPFSAMIFDFSERESTEKSIEIAYHAELKGIHPLVNVYITIWKITIF